MILRETTDVYDKRKPGKRARTNARRRGFSLMEAVITALILSFVVAATASLMNSGLRQQKIGREYSQAQTDLRQGLSRATRAIRHAYGVVNPSTEANFGGSTASNTNQIIVRVPEPAGSANPDVEMRFHASNGTLYAQRDDEAAPGTALMTGVQSLTFNYFQSNTGVSVPMNGTPSQASAVQVRVTAVVGSATTPVETLVTMRNSILGL